jgi:hypothetical protein
MGCSFGFCQYTGGNRRCLFAFHGRAGNQMFAQDLTITPLLRRLGQITKEEIK